MADPIVRRASLADIDAIYAYARCGSFAVSDQVLFYEKTELEKWVLSPYENILLVLDVGGSVCGFLFCKVMSCHWALLDNFYVPPERRGHSFGRRMLQGLQYILEARGIEYLSTLADSSDAWLQGYLAEFGLKRGKSYVWHEIFLKEARF